MLRAFKGIRVIRGLNSFPAQSCIFRRSYQSGEEFDPYAKPLWAKNIRKHQPFVPSKADFSDVRFDEAFDAVNCEFVHDVGLGGYVEVTDEQLDRFLPEGLGGEMYEEFELTERNAWMVRDSTKLLCRIIEEFENTGKRARGETSFEPVTQGLGYPLLLPGLTDRKEWPDATLKVFYYGAEINKGFERKIFAQSVAGTATDKSYSDSSQSYDGLNEDIDPLSIPKENISPKTTLETDDSANVEASNATAPEGAAAVKDPLAEPVPMMYTVNGEGSPVEEFIKTLQKDGKEIPTKIMLTGARGVGKSCSLNQAVLYARQRGWICIFVPEGWEQVWGGDFIEPMTINDPPDPRSEAEILEEQRISDAYEAEDPTKWLWAKPVLPDEFPRPDGTIYDNPSQSAVVLRGFWLAHAELLKTIPLKFPEEVNKYDPMLQAFGDAWERVKSLPGREDMEFMEVREIIEEENTDEDLDELDEPVLEDFDYHPEFRPRNLEEFVRMGVAFREYAGPVFMDLIKELKVLDLPDHPVMFAVDEFNYWESASSFSYRRRKVIGKEMCVPAALDFLGLKKEKSEQYQLKNGLCIGATSSRYPVKNLQQYEDVKSSIPLVIRVPCYSQVEIAAVVSYYTRQAVVDGKMSTRDIIAFRMQTGSNGRLCRRESTSFFFPLAVRKFAGSPEEVLFGGGEHDHDDNRPRGGDVMDDDDDESYETPKPTKPKKFSKAPKASDSDGDA